MKAIVKSTCKMSDEDAEAIIKNMEIGTALVFTYADAPPSIIIRDDEGWSIEFADNEGVASNGTISMPLRELVDGMEVDLNR